jgi:hypothetical protein
MRNSRIGFQSLEVLELRMCLEPTVRLKKVGAPVEGAGSIGWCWSWKLHTFE